MNRIRVLILGLACFVIALGSAFYTLFLSPTPKESEVLAMVHADNVEMKQAQDKLDRILTDDSQLHNSKLLLAQIDGLMAAQKMGLDYVYESSAPRRRKQHFAYVFSGAFGCVSGICFLALFVTGKRAGPEKQVLP